MLEQIELTARGQSLTTKSVFVASNLVNEIKCSFDTDWDVDEIRAVFSNDARGKRISVVLENNECLVPHEVLEDKGLVSVNLVGSVLQGEELIERMTSYKTCIIEVKQKVYVDGANSSPPTPEVWEQVFHRVEEELADKLDDAPQDDTLYGRKNSEWVDIGELGGVQTWNERTGNVEPETGDYSLEMVGGVPLTNTEIDELWNM